MRFAIISTAIAVAFLYLLFGRLSPPLTEEPPGDARLLDGRWSVQLTRERSLGNLHLPIDVVYGELVVAPAPYRDSMGVTVPAPGSLSGVYRLSLQRLIGRNVIDSTVVAFVGQDSSVELTLQIAPNCWDCGDLTLSGQLKRGRIRGRWKQWVHSGGASGSFRIARLDTTHTPSP